LERIERKSILGYRFAVPRQRRATPREEPARTRLDVDERRAQLVALGLDLFGARSYDDVSIDELAAEAGISKGLLYHYFPTKRDFYVATVRESARQLLERTDMRSAEGDPVARLRAAVDAYLDYVVAHAQPYAALLRSGVGTDAEVARVVDETRAALCARLIEGVPLDAPGPALRLALRGWLGFVEATTLDWLDGKTRIARATLRDLLAQMLLRTIEVAGHL
jgi:AcrR family transcriptional regulator